MNIYDMLDTWAASIQADTTIQTYCTTNFSNGLLVQIDDDQENPISSADAPFCLMIGYTGGDDSPIAEAKLQAARIVVGCTKASAYTPTVTVARTATTNGLRKFGVGNLAIDLLDLIIAEIKGINLGSGVILTESSYDLSGLLLFPLTCVGTTMIVRESKDLSTF
jgi:hypothetical protein